MLATIKLVDLQNDLERGSILRCKGLYPYENYVDFLVAEHFENNKRQYALVVISGYKAGSTYVVLPEESVPMENQGYAIDLEWLKLNWHKWGYFDCPLDEVYSVYRAIPANYDDY